jgi:UV DNA damage endonuclease
MRLGLCCVFVREPVAFRATTAKALLELPRNRRLAKASGLATTTPRATSCAETVRRQGIGAFPSCRRCSPG